MTVALIRRNHIDQRVPLLFQHGVARGGQHAGQVGRALDARGEGAVGLGVALERRAGREIGKAQAVVLSGRAGGEHRHRGVAHGAVAGVVEDHHHDRQLVRLGRPMAGGRVGEDHAAVADGRHHEAIGRGELGAQRGADAPAEAAGRAQREIGAGLGPRAGIEPQLILVEDDPVRPRHLADAAAQVLRRDVRRVGLAARACALARSAAARSDRPRSARLDTRLAAPRSATPEQPPARARPRRRWRQSTGGSETSASDSAGTPGPRRCGRRAWPAAAPLTLGIHGTSASMTTIRSASSSKGWGSKPWCSGWSVGRQR